MKKLTKKLLSFLLICAMALAPVTVSAVPVFAEDEETRIVYTGDMVGFFKEDGTSSFGMLTPQEGSRTVIDGEYVKSYIVPKNKTVYNSIHWGLITDEALTKDVLSTINGCWEFSVSTENCGYGLPVAPVKASDGGTTGTQYYLCIPSQDKLNAIADYSSVDAAIADVPEDLSIYTDESAQAVVTALEVINEEGFRYYSTGEQETVDTAAAAINAAIEGLVEKSTEPDKKDLAITNNTGMFKAETAYLIEEEGQTYLVMALSGTGYHELFKGTYEQAVANGDGSADNGNNSWIHGYTNDAGKWEFKIPLNKGESYVPCVAVSDSYYTKYLNGQNSLDRAFYPRQFEVDRDAKTLVTGDYEYDQNLTISNNVSMFNVSAAKLHTVGGPNSNNYVADLELTMGNTSFDKIYIGTEKEAAAAQEAIEIGEGNVFKLPVKWVESFGQPETMKTLIGQPFIASFHSVEKDVWYESEFTVSEKDGTLVINSEQKDEEEKKQDDQKKDSGQKQDGKQEKTIAVGTVFNQGTISCKVTKAGEVTIQKSGNNKAKKVKIPATIFYQGQSFKVTAIADKAFAGSKKLKQVEIGANITTIGKQAFKGDKKLKKIIFKGMLVKKVGKKAFSGISKKATFKAPKKVLKKYRKLMKKAGAPKSAKYKK